MRDTEMIDKLFLELSQFTRAKTNREVSLEVHLFKVETLLREAGDFMTPHAHADWKKKVEEVLSD